jgi:preprotein translocase subunit SecB
VEQARKKVVAIEPTCFRPAAVLATPKAGITVFAAQGRGAHHPIPTIRDHSMADEKQKGAPAAAPAAKPGNGAPPSLNVLAQYIKDLSFENPHSPQSLRPRENAPEINININVNANPLSDTDFEVELKMEAKAGEGKDAMFNVELIYAGVFRLQNMPKEMMHPAVLIECPRMLFPFARQIISDATRNGGFPPLMIDPVDFAGLYQQRAAEEQVKSKVKPS